MKQLEITGPMAITPKALGASYESPFAISTQFAPNGVAVVSVAGPILQCSSDGFFPSYPGIVAAVAQAIEAKPRALVLKINSPGGSVSGCFEACDELRAMLSASGVPSVAYADGQACSAAYALACAADAIAVPATGVVGSIGVLDSMISFRAADLAAGVDVRVITSGPRKSDGHPSIAITDAAEAETQRHVDYLAGLFATYVAEKRSVSMAEIMALGAGVEIGANAKEKKLADEVISFAELVARLGQTKSEGTNTMDEMETIKALLLELAESEDDSIAEKAKRMLAAMEPAPEPAQPEATKSEPDSDPAMARIVAAMETDKRDAMIASRPDLSPAMVTALKSAPLAMVEKMLAAMPRRGAPAPITTLPAQPQAQSQALSAVAVRMGVGSTDLGVKREPNRIVLGVPVERKGK